MPHIQPGLRPQFEVIEHLPRIDSKGDLEYCVARLMVRYMASGRVKRYSDLHDCVKAVEHCAHEFERLFLDPREDEAIESNGTAFWGL